MIETFIYRTEINGDTYQHTVHSKGIAGSVEKWVNRLKDLEKEVYSFDEKTVEQIQTACKGEEIKLVRRGDLNYISYQVNGKDRLTYIDLVNKGVPDFKADLRYLTTEEGGRSTYVVSGYRPLFKLEGIESLTSAEQIFADKDKVLPGESVSAEIRIFDVETFSGMLYQGQEFELTELSNIVAKGVIKELFNEKLKRRGV